MKRSFTLILVIVLGALFLAWQQRAESKKAVSATDQTRLYSEIKPQNIRASGFAVSQKVSSFGPAQPEAGVTGKKPAEQQAREVPNKEPFRRESAGAPHDKDAAVSDFSGAPMPDPTLAFDGISSNDNAAAYGFRILPPDTNGDIGLNHYVQSVNSLTRVYDKNGNPLTPPFKLSSIFSALGTSCSMRNDGDPVVLYDTLADRWFLSQFCSQFPPFRQMIAVSRTDDPTGAYFVYEFVMPNNKINDYPKFGVWLDAYYMSTDEFFGGDYAGSGAFAFDRAKLLAGDPTASYIYFDLASPTTIRIGGILPADHDGLNPPPAGAPNVFVGYTANEYGDPLDSVRLFEFRANFADPAASTFSERADSPLAVAAFDPTSPAGRDDIAQPAPGERLDSQSDRLMYRVGYRNFGTYESLVFNQTVRVTPVDQTYRAGVRVYQLRKAGGAFTVDEQATIGTADTSRWMAAAASDHQGNLAVGYSFGSEQNLPSILYTGRLAGEPAGVFRPETRLVIGTGVQKAFGFRWGDYSAMSVDPADDCTFWITNQYYTLASQEESDFGWLTHIGRFKFSECAAAPAAFIFGSVTNSASGQPIANAVVRTDSGHSRMTGGGGNYGPVKVAPGQYTLTASAPGFRTQSISVIAPDGSNLMRNFALAPTAVLENAGVGLTGESCAVNNAAEPGETVTLSIALRNTGLVNTNDLNATLVSGGGVLNPSSAQSYGALTVNGPAVSRPFTFTVNPNLSCGRRVTLGLRLQDGAEDLGTLAIDLQTGALRIALQENFDAVASPDLPAGWATSASGGQLIWTTTGVRSQSSPLAVFSPDPREVGLNELTSPVFSVASPNAELSFQNWYELETTFLRNRLYDGSVLEIRIGGGEWQDILAAGGSFLSGGYDGTIDGCCQNPLAGRLGWSGRSGINQTSAFITSRAKLPASAAGRSAQLRWRVGTDIGTFREGQYLDDIVVSDGYACSCQVLQTNRSPFDFDGDGRTDLSVFRPSDSAVEPDFLIRNSGSGADASAAWGSTGDIAVNSDYDGDGKTDYAVFRPSGNTWFILRSSDNSIAALNFGLAGDKLAPADFDGDGRSDIAVYRPATGVWYILRSTDGEAGIVQFGTAEDLPVQADFDGDGKADIAVYRPSSGTWYVLRSSGAGATIVRFGLSGDKPVAGDFDGDGKADQAVFRPSDRNWYLLRSSLGFTAVQFGLTNDTPLQADFDGDGMRDLAVFRPGTGVWYYLRSSDGQVVSELFPAAGGTPVPGIFVR